MRIKLRCQGCQRSAATAAVKHRQSGEIKVFCFRCLAGLSHGRIFGEDDVLPATMELPKQFENWPLDFSSK